MTELLDRLEELDVDLWLLADGRLACSADLGTLTPELETALHDREGELTRLLRDRSRGRPQPAPDRIPLSAWNDTHTEYPRDRCVHELVREQALETPTATAVRLGPESLTYAELDRYSDSVASDLRRLGVDVGTLVGLHTGRSLEMIVATLGILKAGGAYLPIPVEQAPDRVRTVLQDAGVETVLADSRGDDVLAGLDGLRVVSIRGLDGQAPVERGEPFRSGARSDDLAYVIYTSGSTGRPKGVMVPHRGLVNHNIALGRLVEMAPGDRRIQLASIGFDVAAAEIFTPLMFGATLVLWPDGRELSLGGLLDFVSEEGLTVTSLSTGLWHELVAHLQQGASLPQTLRAVIVGTEAASTDRLRQWRSLTAGRVRWINAYGPTEASITATVYEPPADQAAHESATRVPIGRPIANMRVHILDNDHLPVEIGAPGELCIAGDGLARGYLNRPDLTARSFLEGPFTFADEDRIYRTGDLARYLPDGNIEFLGRIDRQVKVGGYRVELEEIEAALAQHPDVREAAVVAPETGHGRRLVAYVVPERSPPVPSERLRDHLAFRLPDYMVPGVFQYLARLPRTDSGKVDHRALTELSRPTRGTRTAPRNALERQIERVWCEVLDLEAVGIHEPFLQIGGQSLSAMQIASRLTASLGIDVSLRSIFDSPTIADMAAALAGR